MKRLLVTGASGFLGWHLCNHAKKEWEAFGTVFAHPVDIAGVTISKIDLTDFTALKGLFKLIGPDAVIHTAAATSPNYCQEHQGETRKINVDAAEYIAGLCADYNIPCIFTSTDIVFDGLNAPYREEDAVSPVNIYGEQKAEAEERMLSIYPGTGICRMPLMFGMPGTAAPSFIQPMIESMKQGEELALFVDEFRTPISVSAAVQGLFLALRKVQGIIHLGGRERISRYNLGLLMMGVLGFDKALLMRCHQRDIQMAAPRPPDVSLDSRKAFALGFQPRSLKEEFQALIPFI